MADESLAVAMKALRGLYALGLKFPPITLAPPTVDGMAETGSVVTCINGQYTSPNASNTFTYQWRRDGVNIAGQTAATYTIVQADVGHLLSVVETPSNSSGAGSANASAAVLCLTPLGPATASFSTEDSAGTLIANVTGLGAGEVIVWISPLDGRLALGDGAILVGLRPASEGTITYTVTTSFGRSLSIAVTASALPVPPAGFVFLTDPDGAYLTDPDGAYLVETL